MEYILNDNIKFSIDKSEYNDLICINTKFAPRYILAKDVDLKIKRVLDQNCIIRSVLLKFRKIHESIHISKIYLVDTIHPNARRISSQIYPIIQSNHVLYEYCMNGAIFIDDPTKINEEIKRIFHTISFWNFQSCWWSNYDKVELDINDNEQLYDKQIEGFIHSNRLRRRIKCNTIVNSLKGPLGLICNLKPNEFVEGSMDFLKMLHIA